MVSKFVLIPGVYQNIACTHGVYKQKIVGNCLSFALIA